jgi:hypothetical protein
VRFNIMVNRPMFDYIVAHKLYSEAGQKAFAGEVDFPGGSVEAGATGNPAPGNIGAIMIKLAWKVMGKNDDPTKFHTEAALVYQPAVPSAGIKESCGKAVFGLVGMHIAHKTTTDPQWLWSTFEQVDNDPSMDEVKAGRATGHYNFFDPNCTGCAMNEPPPRPWNPDVVPFPNGFKNQIERVIPLDAATKTIDGQFQPILAGTVWQNYMLISTQWPGNPGSKTDPTGLPTPTFLANTTAETYVQGRVPQVSSNCIECHNNATDTVGKPSDFTYILENAK